MSISFGGLGICKIGLFAPGTSTEKVDGGTGEALTWDESSGNETGSRGCSSDAGVGGYRGYHILSTEDLSLPTPSQSNNAPGVFDSNSVCYHHQRSVFGEVRYWLLLRGEKDSEWLADSNINIMEVDVTVPVSSLHWDQSSSLSMVELARIS